MANTQEPLIVLDPKGKAPIVSYNLPEPTSYTGQNFIELDYGDPHSIFLEEAFEVPVDQVVRTPIVDIDLDDIRTGVLNGMATGFTDQSWFPNIGFTSGVGFWGKPSGDLIEPLPQESIAARVAQPANVEKANNPRFSTKLKHLDPDEAAAQMKAGRRLNLYRSMYGKLTYNYLTEPSEVKPRLLLVETYRFSSFLGVYGAGRVARTFTLLPGESTRVSVRSFTKTEDERKDSSSVLDSLTEESAEDFETTMQNEHSSKETIEQSFEYHAEAEASAGWGWGKGKVSGGVKGGTNTAREEFSKNMMGATQKHANKASAKRDIQINTSYEVKETVETETAIEREIKNINLSRTLNFIFRQMNQEFVSILHLVDVRVAFFNGFAESKREVPLPDLDSLLDEFVEPNKHSKVKKDIVKQLKNVLDYLGETRDFVEPDPSNPTNTKDIFRIKRDLVSTYTDDVTQSEFAVSGIILGVTKNVVRSEGVVVETILGQGDALDDYAVQLQKLEIARREAEADEQRARADRVALLNQIVKDKDEDAAKILAELTCPCGPEAAHSDQDDEETA